MSNDIKIDPSTEITASPVATDEVGGRHYQVVKLAVGGEDTADNVDNLHPIPVSANVLPLPDGAATDAMVAAIRDMEDTLVTQLQMIAGLFPRKNKLGELEVIAGQSSGHFVTASNTVGGYVSGIKRSNPDAAGLDFMFRHHEIFQFSNMGALHLYNGITIS